MKPYLNYAEIVSLHGSYGEPLLSPKLFDILGSIDTKNVYTMFTSNGLLLTKEISHRLILAGLKEINFSIDAAKPATYNKIRNNNGFDTLVQNIKQLINLKLEKGVRLPNIVINMVLMRENLCELPDFIDLAHELGVSTVQVRLLTPLEENYEVDSANFHFDYYQQRIDLNSDEFKRIINIVREKSAKYEINILTDDGEIRVLLTADKPVGANLNRINQITSTSMGNITKKAALPIFQYLRCMRPWETVLIDINGDVRFCCHSRQVLGNLNEADFSDIWNGEIAQGDRSRFLKNRLPQGCLACPLVLPQKQIWNIS